MNFSDSEIVASILQKEGYEATRNVDEADLILVNTCAIRDNAATDSLSLVESNAINPKPLSEYWAVWPNASRLNYSKKNTL